MKAQIHKLPEEFLTRLKKIYPREFPQISTTFLSKKKASFRINYRKIDIRALRDKIRQEHVRCQELQFPQGAFLLKTDLRAFQRSSLYKEGFVFVQNVSSMIPVIVLDPQPSECILDLCAAPGAKATQIDSLLKKSGNGSAHQSNASQPAEVVVVEKVRVRYYKLLANIKVQGADLLAPLLYDGVIIRKKFNEHFDKILLDAPCSAEGRFSLANPRSYRYWKYRKVKEMAHKQKKLFASAYHALKPGGRLVYSTCTFSPEENEEVIQWALERYKDNIEILPIQLTLPHVQNGLRNWRGKKFSPEVSATRRILPNEFLEGFYIAHLRKGYA